jgi:hypothetical protein
MVAHKKARRGEPGGLSWSLQGDALGRPANLSIGKVTREAGQPAQAGLLILIAS